MVFFSNKKRPLRSVNSFASTLTKKKIIKYSNTKLSHAPLDDKSGKTELSAFVSGDLGEGQLLEAAALLVGDLEEY